MKVCRYFAGLALVGSLIACDGEKPSVKVEGVEDPGKQEPAKVAAVVAVDRVLSLQGIEFRVECPNEGSLNQLKITPKGLEGDNAAIEKEVDGVVTGAEVADLNGDGSPEVYVFVQSAGSGSYASLVAYSSNNKKSMSEIYLEELPEGSEMLEGFMGHDEFAVVENVVARRFPVYLKGDSNAKATGGTRQFQYKLKAGEAGWILKFDKMDQF